LTFRWPVSGYFVAAVLVLCAPTLLALVTTPRMTNRWERSDLPGQAPQRAAMSTCTGCHGSTATTDTTHFLYDRARLTRKEWSETLNLTATCGGCHETPDPAQLPSERWTEAVKYMYQLQYYLQPEPAPDTYSDWLRPRRDEYLDVLHYYLTFSTTDPRLPPDPAISGLIFQPTTIGAPIQTGSPPRISNVDITDLDQDGRPDILASDFNSNAVVWISPEGDGWRERTLVRAPYPGRTEVADINGDGHMDVAVAVLGTDIPSDRRSGGVALLINDGSLRFAGKTHLADVGRVSDVRSGDFDGDGDVDLILSIFGWIKEGEIGWLEQIADGNFVYHRISDKAGGVHVIPTDLNEDGHLDVVALIAQEHEEVTAFLNDGHGTFQPHLLFKAPSPTFGSSGIELVDLDQDGDMDILLTNGDAVDLESTMVRPYHGVQWLENRGNLNFTYHPLLQLYGAYRALPGDFDGDGDIDIVVTSLLNDWGDPARKSLIWLENDGNQHFTARGIASSPTHLITAAVGDLDGDGRPDILTGSMHFEPPYDRLGRVTLWRNTGTLWSVGE